MTYSLFFDSHALDQFGQIPAVDYHRVRDAIAALAKEPRPRGCFSLLGRDGWHLRVGGYRVMYGIDDKQQAVTIFHIVRVRDTYQ